MNTWALALPCLLQGDDAHYLDPSPGQRPMESCSIRRENAFWVEIGLGERLDCGLAA